MYHGFAIRPPDLVLQERIAHQLNGPSAARRGCRRCSTTAWLPGRFIGLPRRVAAKVERHQGELYPRLGSSHQPDADGRAGQQVLQRSGTPSSGSRRASPRCAGPGCPATPSATMRCGCSCSPWPTTSPTSCARWRCPSSRAVVADDLREKLVKIGARIVRHGGTSSSSWPRWRCRGRCSPRSCAGSTACEDRPWWRPDRSGPWSGRCRGEDHGRRSVEPAGSRRADLRRGLASPTPTVAAALANIRLTHNPSRTTVDPENRGYLGNVGSGQPIHNIRSINRCLQ